MTRPQRIHSEIRCQYPNSKSMQLISNTDGPEECRVELRSWRGRASPARASSRQDRTGEAEAKTLTVKIADLMAKRVISSRPHQTVGHVRDMMSRNRVHSVPIVGPENEPVGMVTTTDLARRVKDTSPVSRIMTRDIVVVPAYNDVSVAARVMRKHKIHHVIVTHEKQVVGLISSFDLLKLIEGKRFAVSNAPTPSKKRK